MDDLYRMTPAAFEFLDRKCQRHVETYRDPGADFAMMLSESGHGEYREPVGVSIRGEISMPSDPADVAGVARGALGLYRSLEGMSLRLATDPSIFSYINHFYLHEYGLARWPVSVKARQAAEDIRRHWITRRGKSLTVWKQSTSGRLWWMAHTSVAAAGESEGRISVDAAMERFVESPVFFNRTMEFDILRNPATLAECLDVVFSSRRGITGDNYRQMLSRLNREAGGRILDSLDRGVLRRIIEDAHGRYATGEGS